MILYNITYNVDKTIEKEWLHFMKEELMPQFLKTGYFKDNKILKLLNEEYSEEGVTYTFQYFIDEESDLNDFRENYEESIELSLHNRYNGRFVFFKTWLEEV